MATTNHQTMNPSFSNPDDMPEYVSIYDKPRGRPRTYATPEENTEAKRQVSIAHDKEHYLEYKDMKNMKRRLKRSADKENKLLLKTE